MTDLEARIRVRVMEWFVTEARAPSTLELATDLDLPSRDIDEGLRRLHDAHAVVLAPGTTSIWMANPFSALPTRFTVRVSGRTYWGNCIWDSLGVVALFGGTGEVRTACPDCDEPLTVAVEDGRPSAADGSLVHFLLPARRWWDAIGFT